MSYSEEKDNMEEDVANGHGQDQEMDDHEEDDSYHNGVFGLGKVDEPCAVCGQTGRLRVRRLVPKLADRWQTQAKVFALGWLDEHHMDLDMMQEESWLHDEGTKLRLCTRPVPDGGDERRFPGLFVTATIAYAFGDGRLDEHHMDLAMMQEESWLHDEGTKLRLCTRPVPDGGDERRFPGLFVTATIAYAFGDGRLDEHHMDLAMMQEESWLHDEGTKLRLCTRPVPDGGDERRFPGLFVTATIAYAFGDGRTDLVVEVGSGEMRESASGWLLKSLVPKLKSWFLGSLTEASSPLRQSLRLLDLGAYSATYARLKRLHAPGIVATWPEKTDPRKFVYEDVATAAYLITLWEQTEPDFEKRKSEPYWAIDVGCGNGLLVHLLTLEGINCLGVDVRSRKIWSFYGPQTKLKAETVEPNKGRDTLPPARWLLGNHSDELTPWIPLLAARRGVSYWLLPCCPWDYYGKFGRRVEGLSQYRSFLAYLLRLGTRLGFSAVEEDRLKIPSTKRICHVGRWRSKEGGSESVISEVLTEAANAQAASSGQPCNGFTPRPPIEEVRNCSKLEAGLIESLVCRVAKYLKPIAPSLTGPWEPGKRVQLRELAGLLSLEERSALKAQCGGLQTFLRNNGHLFLLKEGSATLRPPPLVNEGKPQRKRICWLSLHHPQGCPNPPHQCSCTHSEPSLS